MAEPASAAERFWAFSLELYGRPGVAPACLSLQDRCGLDVNLLLLCCWTAGEGRALADPDLRAATDSATPWQESVVRPLRMLRRRLKEGVAAVPTADSEALHRRVAALELDAERIEQSLLAASLPAAEEGGAPAGPAGTAAANLRGYLALCGIVPGPAEQAALTAILAGAFPDADPAEFSFAAAG